ncbi:hypothetical protein E3N88_12074 [Mikania micrantha]|uniref:Uncharacterized protein n=1 Tax=Mikania micrantha TaxID=192012 RepID=A0A5N6P7G0_9ASTR|nr:hypothetical protein E3N88_12074 [Mikania micrantha]
MNRLTNFQDQTDYESTSDSITTVGRQYCNVTKYQFTSCQHYNVMKLSALRIGCQHSRHRNISHQHHTWSSVSQDLFISTAISFGITSSAVYFECQHCNFKLSALKIPLRTCQHLNLQ